MTDRRVITERDVAAARQSGVRLTIGPDDVITPAARDAAHRLGMSLDEAPAPESSARRVAIGADHGGAALKTHLLEVLAELDCTVLDCGTHGPDPVDYPVFAARVAEKVAAGDADYGIMIDGAGIGSAMVANKIRGVRAAMCYDVTTAHNAREHNNANVLTLGGTLIGPRLAREIVSTFLRTPFGSGRHARRVAMIDALDGVAP